MEFHLLKNFLAVVREENITRAARSLNMTQPALSRQMLELEESLGTRLFERGRRIRLTDAGRILYRKADDVARMMSGIEREFLGDDFSGTVTIGTGGLAATEILSGFIRDFRAAHPLVTFDFYVNSADHVKDRLDQGLIDFALLMEPVDVAKYDFISIGQTERWGILMPAGHPLAAHDTVLFNMLEGVPLILPSRSEVRKEVLSLMPGGLQSLNVVGACNLSFTLEPLVRHGIACVLLIEGAACCLDPGKVVFRPLEPAVTSGTVLAWRRINPFLTAQERFLNLVRRHYENHAV